MIDAIELARQTEKIVCRNSEKKYYRFRPAPFYGGISTSDCVGCNLSCIFCWSWKYNTNPTKYGNFHSSKEVADKLITIAKKYNYPQCRISGGEPTLGWQHLLKVLNYLSKSGLNLILETNGTLIGCDPSYAKELSDYKDFIHVRVSFKGTNQEEFSKLTGAEPKFFEFQVEALKNLVFHKIPCHPAVMISFSKPESIQNLRDRLETINPSFYDFEEETLLLYGNVKERLKKLD